MAGYMDHTVGGATEIWLHPNNFNWDTEFTLSWPWNPAVNILNKVQIASNNGSTARQTSMSRLSNTDCVMTGMTPPTVPIGSLMDKDTGLRQPDTGTNTMGSVATHNINPDDGGRDSFQSLKHWIVMLYLHGRSHRRLHCYFLNNFYMTYDSYSSEQKIPYCKWNLKVHCNNHKCMPT
jgi:hypothetical protein